MYRKNAWKKYEDLSEVMNFAKGYMNFIDNGKTERLATKESIKILESNGFKNLFKLKSIKSGDKVYAINKNKNVLAMVIGKRPLTDGLRIVGAHIDSPRMDLKENPFYEKNNFCLLDTHYYGGIKKYQWVTVPLSLYGVVVKKDGTVVDINIGDNEGDPVFGVSDLLIHLASDQMQKTLANGIEGENLDVIVGSIPLKKEEKDSVKKNILKLLKEKYDIEEEDFVSAEIEVVPQGKSKDFGFDKSMIAGYGHDDRCCAYPSLKAVIDTEVQDYTSCAMLVDKEEIGSVGATGAHSVFFENTIAKILELEGNKNPLFSARIALENSKMLSSDVSAGYDPLYAGAFEAKNAAYLGNGLVINKYTGSRGKSGSNDANPEYYAWIRKTFDDANVYWQSSELGKVDQGGGGTIAYILGNYNMNVIDAGIPVLSMHAPMEIISKVDLYEAYLGYIAFLKA